MRLVLLLSVLILTSCATSLKLTKVDKEDYLQQVKYGNIMKRPGWFSCFDDKDIQESSEYYHMYNITMSEAEQYAGFLKTNNEYYDGHYRYNQMTTTGEGHKLVTRDEGRANLYDFKISITKLSILSQQQIDISILI